MNQPTEDPKEDPKEDVNANSSIPHIIQSYTERLRAITQCATDHIQHAELELIEWMKKFQKSISVEKGEDPETMILKVESEYRDFTIRLSSPHSQILSESLMIFGFSAFDAFLGVLLRHLYKEEPLLIHKVEEKVIKVGDLLSYNSIDDAVNHVIERDMSSLLRKSYVEVFSILANRHGISTLKKFDNWPVFVEASQRRNLLTHCNGVVNSDYVSNCEKEGVKFGSEIALGKKIDVSTDYLKSCLNVLYEVGVKLAHILWRSSSPKNQEFSEKLLTDEIFELLTREEWALASVIGKFAVTLPKPVKDLQVRISRLNLAQALKWSGDNKGSIRILDEVDWSSSIRDLRMGVAVLRDDFEEAAKLMREIGKKGELVVKDGYRDWPIFREFRKTEQFREAFLAIYHEEFPLDVDVPQANNSNTDVGDDETPQELDIFVSQSVKIGEHDMPSEQPPDKGDTAHSDSNGQQESAS